MKEIKKPKLKKIKGWIHKLYSIPYTSQADKKEIEQHFKIMEGFSDDRTVIKSTKIRANKEI